MRKSWLLIGIALLAAALAIGAVACEDEEDEDGGETPTAEATTPPAGETPTAVETPAEGVVNVNLTDRTDPWSIEPDVTSVPAGTITFNATNNGEEKHELVIIKTDLAPEALPTKADGSVDEAGAGIEVIGEIEEFETGGTESAAFDLEPGSYVLICNSVEEMEGGETHVHYAEGMHAAFTVTD